MHPSKSAIGALIAVGTVALALCGAPAASADDTTVTFVEDTGTLTVSVPSSAGPLKTSGGANPTASTDSQTVSGSLGTIVVTDARGTGNAQEWTVTASTSGFVGAESGGTIGASDISYDSGTVTATEAQDEATVDVTGTDGAVAFTDLEDGTVVSGSGGAAFNGASWNPTITVTVPSGTLADSYTATFTHSVA